MYVYISIVTIRFLLRKYFKIYKLYCRKKVHDYEQIVVTPIPPGVETCSAQLNEENEDFSGRRRYHQTATVTGQYVNVD